MNEKLYRIGLHAVIITSLILLALLLNLRIMNAQATQAEPDVPDRSQLQDKPATARPSEEQAEGWVDKIAERLPALWGKRPIALIALPELFAVDAAGRVLGPADSLGLYDLPLLTIRQDMIDWQRKALVDETALEALKLLRLINDREELAPLVSGLKVQRDQVIAFINLGKTLPVVFGSGNWEQKVENLVEYYRQLGADNLTRQAQSLDLRVEGRIVVKRNG
ncbi:MAG: hypothetical protein ONB24_13470 [candidate division KSB1 bacterium]|nr:hypothetical protein [candidate division KSB1 bacterium]